MQPMKTSNDSGADEAERLFNEKYRDKNGKLLWDKIKEDAAKNWNPISIQEMLRRVRNKKKNDDGTDRAA